MDVFSVAFRSEVMRRVHSKDTKPEITIRRLVYGMGVRYRLHCKYLAGCPDLVFQSRKKAIFVHGCFWHGHTCGAAKLPKSNRAYWRSKQSRNAARHRRNLRDLRASGWKVLTIWECEMKNAEKVRHRLEQFLTKA